MHRIPLFVLLLFPTTIIGAEPIDIGSRRELLVDEFLIDRLTDVELRLHHPTPREVVIVHDAPWEGSGSGYHSIFRDGDRYRMYYKAWQLTVTEGKVTQPHGLFTCYAESEDGIHWTKPSLGLFEFDGSTDNNIVIGPGGPWGEARPDGGHPAVFKDENPDCPPDQRYKAIVRSAGPKGLLVLTSPDGLHFQPLSQQPVITDGAFDSQNLAFWDSERGQYRAYWRIFSNGVRNIRTATSANLLEWSPHQDLQFPGAPVEHLYTNQVKPYRRAPHLLIGFPARYVERPWSVSIAALPQPEHRRLRSSASERYGTAVTDGLLMTSRDGVTFHRWGEAFLRPGLRPTNNWKYGDNYIAWHLVETPSDIEGAPDELSLYATEDYWTGTSSRLRRYTLRMDGFVSAQAGLGGGEVVTKPIMFDGEELRLNFSTSAAGSIRVEIQDADGTPIDGFSLDDALEVIGDDLDRPALWKHGTDVSELAGRAVRLRFVLSDADLYVFRFQ